MMMITSSNVYASLQQCKVSHSMLIFVFLSLSLFLFSAPSCQHQMAWYARAANVWRERLLRKQMRAVRFIRCCIYAKTDCSFSVPVSRIYIVSAALYKCRHKTKGPHIHFQQQQYPLQPRHKNDVLAILCD